MSKRLDPDFLLGLIWVQTIRKGYQQTTKVATSGERVKENYGNELRRLNI